MIKVTQIAGQRIIGYFPGVECSFGRLGSPGKKVADFLLTCDYTVVSLIQIDTKMNSREISLQTFQSGIYSIRQLRGDEVHLYKSMRLEAIQMEPAMFRVTTPAETTLTDAQWQERMTHPRSVFGLFANDLPIGITSILVVDEHEGYLGQSYIRKEYRGKGLSSLLYKARMARASELGLQRLSISHRESNSTSKAANQRFGFRYSHREPCKWLDGSEEDVLYYVLDLW